MTMIPPGINRQNGEQSCVHEKWTMTVLNVAYPLAPVGPDTVGGAEQVLAAIDAALVEAGHRSVVIASEESRVRGDLIPVPAITGKYDSEAMRAAHRECRLAIHAALERRQIDVVHMHGVDFHTYLPPAGVPVLATLHLPISWYPKEIFGCSRPETFLNCVSIAQNSDCPPCGCLLPPIPNGVELPAISRERDSDYALAIGRICPEKGFHLALDAATLARVPLKLAGRVYPYEEHERYFRTEIVPRLRRVDEYLGPVSGEAKLRLYAGARCLVVASTVAETSSLAALEALACGTPVVAFPQGALPEIVTHGKTGFLVNNVEEMARAIGRAAEIDPRECRKLIEERFSMERMISRYLETYQFCISGRSRMETVVQRS